MSSVDNRIVNMEFNNGQFEAGVSQSIGSLEKLKNSLKLDDAATGMSKLSQAAKAIDLSGIEAGVQSLQNRFSMLGVAGMTAIQNFTNRAVNAGVNLVKSFTFDPIMEGFNELETKNKAITTIMSNVGETNTIEDVTAALDELNTYADKTIYNFSEMTQNIGRFTAAGVDLKTSVESIKGLANLAAFAGADNNQAQRAMYQMSQSLAANKFGLMDWNSLVNSGMGGLPMQDLLTQIGRKLGKGTDEAIEKYGSFRESLREGWLDNEVFTKALSYFSAEITDANREAKRQEYIAEGWSEDYANHLVYLGETATDAATRVRSFHQMMDTMHEETGSTWTSTFEMLLGGYSGTTKFWDDIYQAVSPAMGLMNDIRNAGLLSWVNMGSQQTLMDTLRAWLGSDKESTRGIKNESLAIGNAFADVFGVTDAIAKWNEGTPEAKAAVGVTHLGSLLTRFTYGLQDFVKGTQLTETGISNLGDTWQGVASVFDLGLQTFGAVVNIGSQLATAFAPVQEIFLALTAPIGRVARTFRDWVLSFDPFMKLSQGFHMITQPIHDGLQWIADGLTHGFDMANIEGIFGGVLDFFTNLGSGVVGFFTGSTAIPLGEAIGGWFTAAGQQITAIAQSPVFANLGQGLVDGYNKALDFAKPYFENASSLSDYFTGFSQMSSDAFQVVADTAEQYLPVAGKAFKNMVQGFRENTKIDALTLSTFISGHKQLMDMGWTGPMDMTGSMLMDSMIGLSDFMYKFGKVTGFSMPDIFTPMVESAQNAVQTIKGYFSDAHDFSGYFEGAKNMATDMVTYIQGRFQDVAQNLPGIWSNFQEQFGRAKDYVREHAKDIPDATKNMATRVKDTMAGLVERFQSSAVGTSLAGAFDGIKSKVQEVIQYFIDNRGNIWDAIKDFGSRFSEGVKNFLPEVIDWLDDFFGRIVDKFSDVAQNGVFDKIGQALGNAGKALGSGFAEFGKSIGSGFQSFGEFFQQNAGGQIIADIPWTDIAMIGQMIAMIGVLNQAKGLLNTINTGLKDVGDMIQGMKDEKIGPLGWGNRITKSITGFFKEWGKVGTSISTAITKTTKWVGISMFLKALTPVLAAVAGLAGIAIVNPEAVEVATGCVAALGSLFAVLSNLGAGAGGDDVKFNPSAVLNMGQLAIAIAAIAGSVLILSFAVKKLGMMDVDEIQQGMINTGILMGGVTTMMGFMSSNRFGAGGKPGIGKDILLSMIGVVAAVKLISDAVVQLGSMDVGTVYSGLVRVGLIMGEIGAVMTVVSRASKGQAALSNFGTMAGFAIAAIGLALSMQMISGIDWEGILKGVVGMGSVMIALGTALGLMARIGGTGNIKVSGMFGISVAILSIAAAFKILQGVDWGTVGVAVGGLSAILGVLMAFSAGLAIFQGVSNGFTILTNALMKFGAAVALFGIGFAGIAAFVGVLNDLKTAVSGTGIGESFGNLLDGLIEGFASVKGKLMAFVVGVFTSFLQSLAQYADQIVQALAQVIIAAFNALSKYTPEIVSAIHGFCETLFGEIENQFGEIDWGQLGDTFMKLVIAPIGSAIAMKVTKTKFSDILKAAAAVLLIVGPLVAAMTLLSQVGNQTGINAMAGIQSMIESLAGIMTLLGFLNRMTIVDTKSMFAGGVGLGLAIGSVITIVGGIAALIGIIPGAVESISRGTDAMMQVVDVIKNFNVAFVVMAGALGEIMMGTGPMGEVAMFAGGAGIGLAIDGILVAVGALQGVVGAIDQLTDGGVVDALNRGKEAFSAIGGAIGGFFGGLAGGAAESYSNSMPGVAKNINEAFRSMTPMIDDLNEMGDPGVSRIKTFVEAMNAFGGIDPWMADFKAGAFDTFAKKLPDIGTYMKEFSTNLEGVNKGNLDAGLDAMTKMVNFAKDLPDSPDWDLGQWFVGRKQTLSEFAEGLKDFYPAMQEAIGAFGNGETLDTTGLLEAIDAATKISDLQNSLQGFQGQSVVSFFAGRQQNLTEFAQGIGAWKTQLKAATDVFGAADTFDTTGFSKAVDVTNQLKDLALQLPPTESLGSALVGGIPKGLDDFAADISGMATTLSGIDWTFGNFDPVASGYNESRVSQVFGVITRLTNMAKELPVSTEFDAVWGLIHWESGSMTSLGEFCTDISNHATEIGSCMTALGGIHLTATGRSNIPIISSALSSLASAQGSLAGLTVNTGATASVSQKVTSLGEFVKSLNETDFVTQMQSFMGAVGSFQPPGGDFNNLTLITGAVNKLAEAYNSLPPDIPDVGTNGEGDGNKVGRLSNLASQATEMVDALEELSGIMIDDKGGFNQGKWDSLNNACDAVQKLADAYNTVSPAIEDMGRADGQHMYKATDVSKNWTTFTDGLSALATGMREFWSIIDDMEPEEGKESVPWNSDRISSIIGDVQSLAGLVGEGGALKDLDTQGFDDFSDALKDDLGPAMKGFYNSIMDFDGDPDNGMDGIDTAKISDIIGSVQQLAALTGDEGALKNFNADGFDELARALDADLGSSLKDFYSALFGEGEFNYNQTQLQNAMAGIPLIANAFNDLPELTGDVSGKVTILSECIGTFLDAFFGGGAEGGPAQLFQNRLFGGGQTNNIGQIIEVIGQLQALAKGITAISNAFTGMGEIDLPQVQGFTTQLGKLMDIFGGGGHDSLQGKLGMFGGDTAGTYSSGASDIMSVITNVQQFAGAMTELSTALSGMGGAGVDGGVGSGGVLTQLSELMDKMSAFDFAGLAANIQLISDAFNGLGGTGGPIGPTLSGAPMGGGSSGLQMLIDLMNQLQSVDIAGTAASVQQMADALNSLGGGGMGGASSLQQLIDFMHQISEIDFSGAVSQIQAFSDAMRQVASGMQDAANQVVQTITEMVRQCIDILTQAVDSFRDAGNQAAQGYASGISAGTGSVVGAVNSMVHSAVAAAQGGWGGFYSAGVMAASGMAAGIRSAAAQVAEEAAAMVSNAIEAAKGAMQAHSPSRKFMQLGGYAGQGFAIGMREEGRSVAHAVNDMILPAIQKARELSMQDMTVKPLIQPVVDMSNVETGVQNIEGRFSSMHTQALTRGVSIASSVARRMRENEDGTNTEQETQPGSVTYNFTQNNTSPKALSRSEIYRDTKNLFALVKERASK